MSAIQIRVATMADVAAVAAFAARTFSETFGAYNRPEDMAAYMSAAFAPAIEARAIAASNEVVLLAHAGEPAGDSVLAGYAHLSISNASPSVSRGDPLELKRFYVASEWHGRGIAQALMGRVRECATELGARTLWLGVWEQNLRAIAFYRKVGFRETGTQPFQLGDDVQTDLVMVLPIALMV